MINGTVVGYQKDTTKTMRTRLQVHIKSNDALLKSANCIDCGGYPVFTALCFDDVADRNYDMIKDKVVLDKTKIKAYGNLSKGVFWLEDISC